ncbi:MAG TPA: condensation domain-containing protein, partial [Pyrinomonadaceae bacterium]
GADAFDTVVLNSVIQYFPDVDYLVRVLEGAVRAVSPGGSVFVGDVRSLPLLEAFHTSILLQQAPPSLPKSQLRQRVQKQIAEEKELVIDPAFFSALQRRLPQVREVEIQLKRGHYHNELTRFRYDVVLHVGPDASPAEVATAVTGPQETDWQQHPQSLQSLREFLLKTDPEAFIVRNVTNRRLAKEFMALRLLNERQDDDETVGTLCEALADFEETVGIDPEALWSLGQELPFEVRISWHGSGRNDRYDVVFEHRDGERGRQKLGAGLTAMEAQSVKPWSRYANNPLRRHSSDKLISALREWLRGRLPEYMVPSAFVVLEGFPLTPNGKVDRKALPAPGPARVAAGAGYEAPRTPVEEVLAGVFAEVLKAGRVGASDNFFELGGHSLLATQAAARAREALGVEVGLRQFFEHPTVRGLAAVVEEALRGGGAAAEGPIGAGRGGEELPLSFAQQRLWFLDQLEEGHAFYNIPSAVRLTGTLDVEALRASINAIVARHEALRTTFSSVDGQPVQVIASELRLEIPVTDLRALDAREQGGEVRRLAG